MDEFEVGEERVGHVLEEEGRGADEVECYSVWTVLYNYTVSKFLFGLVELADWNATSNFVEGEREGGRN